MFDNIGFKIKMLAVITFGILLSISVLASLYVIFGWGFAFLGVCSLVFGVLFSCVSVFTLYGFGHLIENSDKMVENKLNGEPVKKQSRITDEFTKHKVVKRFNFSLEECYNIAKKKTAKLSSVDRSALFKKYKVWNEQIVSYSLDTLCSIINNEQEDWQEEYILLCYLEIVKKFESKNNNTL